MIHKIGLAGAATVAILFVAGWQVAVQSERPASTAPQSGAVAPTAIVVSQPDQAGALKQSLDRVATTLTEAECTGLGGVVVNTISKSCKATGKACYRADQSGVIHQSCITQQ